jgi:hypothetical protein
MKDLSIFRLFLAFPLIGLMLPDAGLLFTNYRATHIPASHLIVIGTLSICIMICSIKNKPFKRKHMAELPGKDMWAEA